MGHYTEICIAVEFKRETPQPVIDALTLMAGSLDRTSDEIDALLPESVKTHRLFSEGSPWRYMLRSGGSYYIAAQPCLVWRFDETAKAWFLTLHTNIKGAWDDLLDFIAPWIETSGFIGYERFEYSHPTILYCYRGIIETARISPDDEARLERIENAELEF